MPGFHLSIAAKPARPATRGRAFGWLSWVVLVAALSGPAQAQDVDPATVVGEAAFPAKLTTEPGRIVLGEVDRVRFRVEAPEPAGPLRPLRASVNVGSLAEVTRTGPGLYEFAYQPPPQHYPQVAIVAVWRETGPDAPVAFFRVPLLGTARVPVETEPRATVTVAVGGARFGPVSADARGRVSVRLVVPPGVPVARITARTQAGKTTSTELPLGVPPYNRITLAVVPHTLTADGVSEARLHLYYDAVGHRPPTAARVRIEAPVGQVQGVVHLRGPLYTARYTAPAGTPDQALTFSARIRGDRRSSATATVQLGRQIPARLEIAAADAILADGEQSEEVRVTVLDALGLGVPGVAVELTFEGVEGLRFDPIQDLGAGVYGSRVHAPRIGAGEAREARLVARAGDLSDVRALRLDPNLPRRIEVDPAVVNLVADGGSAAVFRVRVLDAAGRIVRDRPPQIEGVSAPEITVSAPDAAGVFSIRFAPRRWVHNTWSTGPGPRREVPLRFEVGPAEAAATVLLTAEVRSLVGARRYVEVLGGWRPGFDGLGGPEATVSAGYSVLQRGRLDLALGLRGGVSDLRGDLRVDNDLGEGAPLRLRVVGAPVLAQVRGGYRLGDGWLVGLGLEAGVLLQTGAARLAGTGDLPVGGVGAAFGARLLLGRRLGPGLLLLEAGWLQALPGTAGRVRIDGSLGAPAASFGYRLEL